MILLDTHMLLFALTGELKARERKALENNPWSLASISLWEIATLIQRGRVEVETSTIARALRSVRVWPIDWHTAEVSASLKLTGDPADRLIVATGIVNELPLATRDTRIRRSRLVELV